MTPSAPTWADVEAFLGVDGWRRVSAGERGGRRQRHVFFEKVLPGGRLLTTHISHDRDARMSPGRFSSILRGQLEVSREQFWQALESGQPVNRPVELDEDDVVELPGWTLPVLTRELLMTADEIGRLTPEEAVRLVHEHWAQPRDHG